MKTCYPFALFVLISLSGCSSFMGGRFSSWMGGRFAAGRRGDTVVMSSADHTERFVPIQEATVAAVAPPTLDAANSGPASEPVAKKVKVENSECERLPQEVDSSTAARTAPEPEQCELDPSTALQPAPPAPLAPMTPPASLASAPEESGTDMTPSAPKTPPAVEPSKGLTRPAAKVHYVRNKRLRLDYEVRGAAQSGVSSVELWYTSDGRHWAKTDAALPQRPPYIVDFGEEGRYGITLVAQNAAAGRKPPTEGDKPQTWVEIDGTKPLVAITDVGFDTAAGTMTVCWTASDRNLDPRSVCLSYATEPGGPWLVYAKNVDNTGKYNGKIDLEEGQRVFVRVEVTDLAGNVGAATSDSPRVVDSEPSALITKVEEAP